MEEKEKPKKKQFLFSFEKINKYYFFPFIAPIFCCITNFFIHSIYNENKDMEKHLFFTLYIDFTYLIGGLLFFISKIRNKTEETRNDAEIYKRRASSSLKVKYIYNDKSKKSKIKILLMLFLISTLITITTISNLYSLSRKNLDKRFYFIIFIIILSKYILNINIYKHQILSMMIALTGILFIDASIWENIKTDDYFSNIWNIFSSLSYTFFLVMVKYLTHNYYFSPLLCILFIGIISIIITFFVFMAISLYKESNLSLIINNFDFSKNTMGFKYYIFISFGLISGPLLQLFTIYVVYYFSPILLIVTDSISPILSWIFENIFIYHFKNSAQEIILKIFGYLIVLFGALIYNEIIICNFCGLNKYTKKYLKERENQELISLKKN